MSHQNSLNPNLVTSTRHHQLIAHNLSINIGPDDMIQFTGLPTRYIIRRLRIFNPSVSLGASAATIGLFTDSSGGGVTLVTLATVTGLTAASKYVDMTLATIATTDWRTDSVLFLRNGVRHGSAATVSALLEIDDILS